MKLNYLFLLPLLFFFVKPVSAGPNHQQSNLFVIQKNHKVYLAENRNASSVNPEEFQGDVELSDEREEEYKALLEEKKQLENDKSFQKRKKKRKYKNRPYMQELIKKEQRINERLEELEKLSKAVSEEK